MSYMSFDCELDFVNRRDMPLVAYDGVVSIDPRIVIRQEAYTVAELAIARKYAEYHLNRSGEKFVRCTF